MGSLLVAVCMLGALPLAAQEPSGPIGHGVNYYSLEKEAEVYAGFMEHTDHHVGRLIDSLQDLGILEDTLIYLINGASAEGSLQGCFNEMAPLTGFPELETAEFLTERLDQLGGVEAYNH
jgi:Sulfatase